MLMQRPNKAQSHFNLIPGLKAGAPTLAAQWDFVNAGLNSKGG